MFGTVVHTLVARVRRLKDAVDARGSDRTPVIQSPNNRHAHGASSAMIHGRKISVALADARAKMDPHRGSPPIPPSPLYFAAQSRMIIHSRVSKLRKLSSRQGDLRGAMNFGIREEWLDGSYEKHSGRDTT